MGFIFRTVLVLIVAFIGVTAILWMVDDTHTKVDYETAEAVEAAMNDGADLRGSVVSVEVDDFIPDGTLGYTIHTGEHLNFIGPTHPGVGVGDTLTAEITEVVNMFGRYVISYELIEDTDDFWTKLYNLWNFNGWLDEVAG